MNVCLGIQQDKDIRYCEQVDPTILALYNSGRFSEIPQSAMPGTRPFLLDFTGSGLSKWNIAVWGHFRAFLHGRETVLSEKRVPLPTEEELMDMFVARIATLRRYVRDLEARERPDGTVETQNEINERINRSDKRKLDEARRNARRHEVISRVLVIHELILIKHSFSFIELDWTSQRRICATRTGLSIGSGGGSFGLLGKWVLMVKALTRVQARKGL